MGQHYVVTLKTEGCNYRVIHSSFDICNPATFLLTGLTNRDALEVVDKRMVRFGIRYNEVCYITK